MSYPAGEAPWLVRVRAALFIGALCAAATPWASPPVALAAGMLLALTMGNPFPAPSARASKTLLKASVVLLGFGVPLATVIVAGVRGVGYTALGIVAALGLGLAIGRLVRVERTTSWLIAAGTAICGGSAIAAVGPAIRARAESMGVALATVFVLNAVALYAFPPIGTWLGLSQHQFAVWAAIAIHDTGSVVGAAAVYGGSALEEATVLKLVRTLWITPVVLLAAYAARRAGPDPDGSRTAIAFPWFVVLFVAASALRSLVGPGEAVFDGAAWLGRRGLVVTLFLIGAGLTRRTLAAVGPRPFVQGAVLWLVVTGGVLLVVTRAVAG